MPDSLIDSCTQQIDKNIKDLAIYFKSTPYCEIIEHNLQELVDVFLKKQSIDTEEIEDFYRSFSDIMEQIHKESQINLFHWSNRLKIC